MARVSDNFDILGHFNPGRGDEKVLNPKLAAQVRQQIFEGQAEGTNRFVPISPPKQDAEKK